MLSALNVSAPILPTPRVNGMPLPALPRQPHHQTQTQPQTQTQTLAASGLPHAGVAAAADLAALVLRAWDHVGRGMLLVAAGGRVLHANRLALQALQAPLSALRLVNGQLQARDPADAQRLDAALQAALRRGLRDLLPLGQGENATTAAVLPIEGEGGAAAVVSLEQPRNGLDMAVQWFARQHNLTTAETAVLAALRAGDSPSEIAQAKAVALSTVRTQIGQLRQKTGSHSIRQLLDRVGGLPPMMQLVR